MTVGSWRGPASGRSGKVLPWASGTPAAMALALSDRAPHEVSYRKDDRPGFGSGKVMRTIITPPQHGQRLCRHVAGVSSAGTIAASGVGASSSLRHSASFSAR